MRVRLFPEWKLSGISGIVNTNKALCLSGRYSTLSSKMRKFCDYFLILSYNVTLILVAHLLTINQPSLQSILYHSFLKHISLVVQDMLPFDQTSCIDIQFFLDQYRPDVMYHFQHIC